MAMNTISTFLANANVHQYIVAVIVAAGCALGFALVQYFVITYVSRLAERTENKIDDAIVAMLKSVRPPFYWSLAIYAGLKTLDVSDKVGRLMDGFILAWLLFYLLRSAGIGIDMLVSKVSEDEGERSARKTFALLAKIALWIVAMLLVLSNIGINITSLVAGLGIGGIAVAFALQNVLSDLFSSFAIYFDKPFEVGDFIITDKHMGTVERIGIKTTRIAALQGEQIVISNRELTSARIQNFKHMQQRRVQLDFGIAYETPREAVMALPEKIRAAFEAIPGVIFGRAHFARFDDSALGFQLVYFVPSGDYDVYMDRQQDVNFALLALFEKESISFAYPTQTVHLAHGPAQSSVLSQVAAEVHI